MTMPDLIGDSVRESEGVLCSLEPTTPGPSEAQLLGSFVAAHYPDATSLEPWLASELSNNPSVLATLAQWVQQHAPPGPALDLGCGPGRFAFDLATGRPMTGLDVRMTMLSFAAALRDSGQCVAPARVDGERWSALEVMHGPAKASPIRFVLADACDPPFSNASFSVVSALMLLDTVADPEALLLRARDLLVPSGVLLLSSSYSWDERNTPKDRWWSDGPATLRARLADLQMQVVEERDDLVWAIPGSERTVFRYRLDCVLAQKT